MKATWLRHCLTEHHQDRDVYESLDVNLYHRINRKTDFLQSERGLIWHPHNLRHSTITLIRQWRHRNENTTDHRFVLSDDSRLWVILRTSGWILHIEAEGDRSKLLNCTQQSLKKAENYISRIQPKKFSLQNVWCASRKSHYISNIVLF